jgi:hypothetical protein
MEKGERVSFAPGERTQLFSTCCIITIRHPQFSASITIRIKSTFLLGKFERRFSGWPVSINHGASPPYICSSNYGKATHDPLRNPKQPANRSEKPGAIPPVTYEG